LLWLKRQVTVIFIRGLGPGAALGVPGLAVAKVDAAGQNLRAAALVAVPVCPVTHLEPAFHHGHAAFVKILVDELTRVPPRNDVEIVHLLLAVRGLKIALSGDGELHTGVPFCV